LRVIFEGIASLSACALISERISDAPTARAHLGVHVRKSGTPSRSAKDPHFIHRRGTDLRLLLNVTGWGLEGWQWLFIPEALPSILVELGVLFYLTDFPRQAAGCRKTKLLGWRPCKQSRKYFRSLSAGVRCTPRSLHY
jgi:hypothetical protein